MRYWLMKSEPGEFSIDDLEAAPEQTEHWDGVRNYQARNMMRDEMEVGDQVLFYHSNTKPPGVVGVAEVAREGYPDHTAFDPQDPHFDPKSDPDDPRWFMVDVRFVERFPKTITLDEIKAEPTLSEMRLVQRGNRLSVMPVSAREFKKILRMKG